MKYVVKALRKKFLRKIRNPGNICDVCKAYMSVFKTREYKAMGTPCSTCTSRWRRFLKRFYIMVLAIKE